MKSLTFFVIVLGWICKGIKRAFLVGLERLAECKQFKVFVLSVLLLILIVIW